MEPLLSLLESNIGADQTRMLAVFLFFLPIFFFAYWSVKRGLQFSLRAIPGYAAIKTLPGRSAEAGQPVHLSVGTAGIGNAFTADTTAAFYVLDYLAERGAVNGMPPLATVAHPTALPVAQDILRRAYRRQGYSEDFDPTRARFIAPDPAMYTGSTSDGFPYAVGAMQILDQQKLVANVMVGRFGDEFLLMGEAGARRNLTQIGGTSAERVLPFVQATMTHPLIGEEIYAGGAYLSDKPAHLSSLLAQDVMRWLLAGGVVIGVVLKTIGLF